MKFQTKIFFATLFILAATLSLNSILSTSSFENIYADSLTSTYKVGGKILKRKIDSSLKFGKPLSHFKGMDELLKDFILDNRYVDFAGIVNPEKEILYHSDKGKKGSLLKYPLPDKIYETSDIIKKSLHITFIPLSKDKGKTISGYLFFGFNSSIIKDKVQNMTIDNLKTLSILIVLTGVILIFFIGITIVKPLKKSISKISGELSDYKHKNKSEKNGKLTASSLEKAHLSYFEIEKIKNEIWKLTIFFKYLKLSYSDKTDEIRELMYEFKKTQSEIDMISHRNQEKMEEYLRENRSDYKISSLYKYIKNENIHIKRLMNLCCTLLSGKSSNRSQ